MRKYIIIRVESTSFIEAKATALAHAEFSSRFEGAVLVRSNRSGNSFRFKFEVR